MDFLPREPRGEIQLVECDCGADHRPTLRRLRKRAMEALSAYIPVNHRSQAVHTDHNWVLLDAYNANPSSMAHAVTDFASRGHHPPALGHSGRHGRVGRRQCASARRHGRHVPRTASGPWVRDLDAFTTRRPRTDWMHFEECDDAVMHLQRIPLRRTTDPGEGSRSAALERLMPNL